ncbi:hypothetical protein ACN2C3_04130 [Aliarcobacter butzleri]
MDTINKKKKVNDVVNQYRAKNNSRGEEGRAKGKGGVPVTKKQTGGKVKKREKKL